MKALLGAGRFNVEHSHSGNDDLTAAMQRTQGTLLPHNLPLAPGLATRGQRTRRIPLVESAARVSTRPSATSAPSSHCRLPSPPSSAGRLQEQQKQLLFPFSRASLSCPTVIAYGIIHVEGSPEERIFALTCAVLLNRKVTTWTSFPEPRHEYHNRQHPRDIPILLLKGIGASIGDRI